MWNRWKISSNGPKDRDSFLGNYWSQIQQNGYVANMELFPYDAIHHPSLRIIYIRSGYHTGNSMTIGL